MFYKNCGNEVNGNSEKENNKKRKKGKWPFGKIFFRVLLILLLLIAIVIALDYYGILQFSSNKVNQNEGNRENVETLAEEVLEDIQIEYPDADAANRENIEALAEEVLEDIQIEHPDADAYYEQNAELLATIEVTKSENVLTEKDAERTLTERGFSDYPIWSEYSIDGEYYGEQEIAGTIDKHPTYQTYYVTGNDEMWTIIVTNGSVVANPVSFNMQSQLGAQVVFSETNVITSYDSVTNKFYESIPNESELIVYVVDKIDANTINKLTVEVIEGYEQ